MSAPPLAHVGHWYHVLIYLAPVFVIAIVLWVTDRRAGDDEPADDDTV